MALMPWKKSVVNASDAVEVVIVEDLKVDGLAAGKGSAVREKGLWSPFSCSSVGSSCGLRPLTLAELSKGEDR